MMASLSAKRNYEDDDSTEEERKKHHTDLYLTYDVLRLVFKYFNWVDLSNASMVCRCEYVRYFIKFLYPN